MDITTIPREVFSTSADETLAKAARQMRAHDVSALMVYEDEEVVGIVTERDLTRAVAEGESPQVARVAGFMTQSPITVAPGTGMREAAAEMLETDVRHLPIEVGGEVIGMFSLRDLLSVVVDTPTP
jgi:CBS domain-containing protein